MLLPISRVVPMRYGWRIEWLDDTATRVEVYRIEFDGETIIHKIIRPA